MSAKHEPTVAQTMTEAVAELMDNFAVMSEAAKGYRDQLERDGWSPTQAEVIAAEWLILAQRKAFE